MHARVALYTITDGTVEELALAVERGLLPAFRAAPGFISYRLVATEGDTCLSLSRWETYEQAEAAAQAAAAWVAEHLAGKLELEDEHLGEVVLSSD